VDNSKNNPGNANLTIGGDRNAIQENGVPRALPEGGAQQNANLEIGVPGGAVWHSRGYLPHFESSSGFLN
jgi:hypothetical protein